MLLEKNRTGDLTPDEEQLWQHYQYLEHIVRMAKARAFLKLNDSQTPWAKPIFLLCYEDRFMNEPRGVVNIVWFLMWLPLRPMKLTILLPKNMVDELKTSAIARGGNNWAVAFWIIFAIAFEWLRCLIREAETATSQMTRGWSGFEEVSRGREKSVLTRKIHKWGCWIVLRV